MESGVKMIGKIKLMVSAFASKILLDFTPEYVSTLISTRSEDTPDDILLDFQCDARYALDYFFSSSVVTNHLKERNTICAISINKQGDSQQMNVLPIFD